VKDTNLPLEEASESMVLRLGEGDQTTCACWSSERIAPLPNPPRLPLALSMIHGHNLAKLLTQPKSRQGSPQEHTEDIGDLVSRQLGAYGGHLESLLCFYLRPMAERTPSTYASFSPVRRPFLGWFARVGAISRLVPIRPSRGPHEP